MKNLLILVKMQLKEQLNFKRFEIEKVNLFHILMSTVGTVLKFALVTVRCGAFLTVARTLGLFSPINMPIPISFMSLVFSIMLLLSVFSCTVGLTNAMYYARDNAILLTLPCSPLTVYLSKLIIFFIFEIKRNLSFIVPLFIAYFITHGYGVGAYFWMLFCIMWISLFTVAIGSILSIPAMWIANFFRQRRYLQIGSLVVLISGAVLLLFGAISLIPADIDLRATWETTYWQIQDFLAAYKKNFAVPYSLAVMLLGEIKNLVVVFDIPKVMLVFGVLVALTIVLIGLGLLLVKPLFYKMASTPFEYLKKATKPKKNKVRSRRFTSVYNNFLVTLKSSNGIFSIVGIVISVPMLIFLLNKIFLAMNTRELGDHMIVAFNVLIILLIVLNSNCTMASIFSRDGRSAYLLKTHPSKYPILILTKLLPNTFFGCLSILATFVILLLTLHISVAKIILLTLSIGMTYVAHMLYCAVQDLMNPQHEMYATVGNSENNPNETKATITAFIISFVAALLMFILLIEGSAGTYIKFLIISLIALIYRTYLLFSVLRLYYKEK